MKGPWPTQDPKGNLQDGAQNSRGSRGAYQGGPPGGGPFRHQTVGSIGRRGTPPPPGRGGAHGATHDHGQHQYEGLAQGWAPGGAGPMMNNIAPWQQPRPAMGATSSSGFPGGVSTQHPPYPLPHGFPPHAAGGVGNYRTSSQGYPMAARGRPPQFPLGGPGSAHSLPPDVQVHYRQHQEQHFSRGPRGPSGRRRQQGRGSPSMAFPRGAQAGGGSGHVKPFAPSPVPDREPTGPDTSSPGRGKKLQGSCDCGKSHHAAVSKNLTKKERRAVAEMHMQNNSKAEKTRARRLARLEAACMATRPPATAACMQALGLMAVSGFPQVTRLERTCVELSNACRRGAPWALLLKPMSRRNESYGAPRRLLRPLWPQLEQKKSHKYESPRLVRRHLIKRIEFRCSGLDLSEIKWPQSLEKLMFKNPFREGIPEQPEWPPGLLEIHLGTAKNLVEDIRWPSSLKVLVLGRSHNVPVHNGVFPDGLEQLTFGESFNQSITRVTWPTELRVLKFGNSFDQPVDDVRWPEKLRELHFAGIFDQSLDETVLPKDLVVLILGDSFNHLVSEVKWPPNIHTIKFSVLYDERLDGMVWPKSLKHLTVPDTEYGTVPEGCKVEKLVCGDGDGQYFGPSHLNFGSLMHHMLMGPSALDPFGMPHMGYGYHGYDVDDLYDMMCSNRC